MRLVQNTTLQGFYVTFNTNFGLHETYLKPKGSLMIPDHYTGKIFENLVKRRLLKVTKLNSVFPVKKTK